MSRMQIDKLQFVGEPVGLNEYEAACTLAEDVELRAGLLVPRFDDYRATTQAAQRACMVDVSGGTLRWKNSSGYVFAFGDDAYFLNSDGNWLWVKADGAEATLNKPNASFSLYFENYYSIESLNSSNGSWNVTPDNWSPPTWNNISGAVGRTYTFNSSKDWSGASYLVATIEVPAGADSTMKLLVNGNEVPIRLFRQGDTVLAVWVVNATGLSSVSSIGFSYNLTTTHTLKVWFTIRAEYSVPVGEQVYAVSVERNGVESVLSTPRTFTLRNYHKELDTVGVAVDISISPAGSAGDKVRLYRAIDGKFVEVGSYVASGQWTNTIIYDKGDKAEGFYRPSGELPFGPAAVVGNRVAIASGRTLWVSQAGNPTRFGATAINEDNIDAYTVVLPAALDAIAPAEGGIVCHTRRGQYFVPLVAQYDNDLLHARPPVLVDDRAASSFKAAASGALISDGRLFVDGQLVAAGLAHDAWVVRVAGRVFALYNDSTDGYCLVWSPAEWQGALRWKLPAQVSWAFSYGDDLFIATSNGIYHVAGNTNRKSSCRWRTGRRFMPALSAIRFVHLAGSGTVKLIRPGKSDVVLNNVSGRVNVPSVEQTHEWLLELNTSSGIYQCFVTLESGIQ